LLLTHFYELIILTSGHAISTGRYEPDSDEGVAMSKEPTHQGDEARTLAPKKPYRTPQVVEYGHISKLTAGTTGTAGDKGTMANHHGMG
jgi:hypothetical protein